MPLDNADEIKKLIEDQGKAFDAFKATHAELKSADVVTEEKLAKIEKSLDAAVEAKAAIDARFAAEKKEREDLELRLARRGLPEADGKFADEVKSHGVTLGREMSEDDYRSYKAGLNTYLRKGEKVLDGAEFKAMSVGGDPDGGYFVTPDTAGRMVKKIYESSPIRQIASVQPISSDKLEGIEDLGEAGAGWVGETATRPDTDTPQIGKWSIEAFEMYASPKTTQKLLDDAAVDIEAWLAGKTGDRFARLEATAFVAGTGAGQPRGLTSYATAADSGAGVTWGTLGHVVSGANGDFAASNPGDKLFDLIGLVKDGYLSNARFLASRAVITKIRKFKVGTGEYLWQPSFVAGVPESIAGYPVTRAEDMPALATGSLSLAFGDFAQGYQIVDRLGVRTLRDPFTDKPYVKFYSIKRVGGAVVNFEAIKFLKFSAS